MSQKIEQKTWILLNVIKGDSIAYLPWCGEWYARVSMVRINKEDFRMLQEKGYIETKQGEVLLADITPAGIAAWEAVPGGIERIEGRCDECAEIRDLRPLYFPVDARFIYLCSDCRSRDYGRMRDGLQRGK